jgi:hypothetical protein
MTSMRETGVDAKVQSVPFQMKYGIVAGAGAVLIPRFEFPAMTLQMASASGMLKRMSIPFSCGPLQVVVVVVPLVLVQVRIAASTICVGVKRSTGGKPLSPGGPCGPCGPVAPVAPFDP